ncbi:MAG: hypothetical protein RI957_1089 [Verrucomicrobiota bacterium]|jgi:hypothetical protein
MNNRSERETSQFCEEDVMRHVEQEETVRRQTDWYFLLKFVLVFLFVLAVLAFFMTPSILRAPKKLEMTQAISNSKQVYLVLLDFEADHGKFPDDSTATKHAKLHGFHGACSNRYLGQLIAGGYTKSEEIFYAFDKRYGKRRADDVISPMTRILEKGECGFSYVMVEEMAARRGLSTQDNGGIPVLVAPLLNEWGSCEKKSYDGRGVYLRVDGSARSERLKFLQ